MLFHLMIIWLKDIFIEDGITWRMGKLNRAIKEYDKALKYNPNYWQAYSFKGFYVYLMDLNKSDYVKGLEYLNKAASINHGKELALYL